MSAAAEFIEKYNEDILARFEKRLREAYAAEWATRSELRDQLPRYLRFLSHVLRAHSPQKKQEACAECQAAGVEHGEQRLRLGFDPGHVVCEYGYLLDVILQLAEEQGVQLSLPALRELAQQVNVTCAQAIAAYARLRDVQQRQQAARHLSFLAHELRDPLNAAQLALDLLGHGTQLGQSRAGQALHRGLDRMRDLIDVTLTSGLLGGGVTLDRTALSLVEVIAEGMTDSEVYAHSKGIHILLDAEEGLTVEGDRRLLRSVLSNLLRNAVKFTTSGTIAIRLGRSGQNARVEVEDSCGGLPPDKVESLFRPFVQVGEDRSGFGLGLAISQQAILAHGGRMFVKNLPGKGCIFGFELPLEPAGIPGSDEAG